MRLMGDLSGAKKKFEKIFQNFIVSKPQTKSSNELTEERLSFIE